MLTGLDLLPEFDDEVTGVDGFGVPDVDLDAVGGGETACWDMAIGGQPYLNSALSILAAESPLTKNRDVIWIWSLKIQLW